MICAPRSSICPAWAAAPTSSAGAPGSIPRSTGRCSPRWGSRRGSPTTSATTRSASPSTTSTSRASSSRTIRSCSTSTSRCRRARLRVGQLGIVLPANNPIRVAEDIAMLDQMSGGRANAGFARGYQRRWVDVMAQQTHGIHGAQPHQHDAIDAANREAFEECFRIIKRAWTEDFLDYQGRYWKIPRGRDSVGARGDARAGAAASRTASCNRSRWCPSRCRSRIRRSSSPSRRRSAACAGARPRA